MIISLNKLSVGQKAIIDHIEESQLKDRFLDLGFTPSSLVECVLKSPFKDPSAYKIKGTIIAIRAEDAQAIKVGVIND